MDQDLGRFANAYDNATTLDPLGVAMLAAALITIFLVRRDWIFLPIVALTCLVPASLRLVVLGLDFPFLRLAAMAGLFRIWVRGEARPLRWTNLDKAVVAWVAAATLSRSLREFSGPTLVNTLGVAFDTLGLYLLARFTLRDWRDLETLIRSFALASVPVLFLAIEELRTGKNPFAIFPGIREAVVVRDGTSRFHGAFSHEILAGCYYVGPVILYTGLLLQRSGGILVPVLGLACGLALIVASGSSTPLLGFGLAALAALLWPLRSRMREVRWGLVAALVVVQIAMNKPIWHLYQRASAFGVGGSKGFHRYRLIDAFVGHFSDWALLGLRTTSGWGRQLDDVTNHFILQGVRGGLLTLMTFVAIFVFAFSQVGALRAAWSSDWRRSAFAWSLGLAVFAHLAMMTSVSYVGQILVVFWATLGAVAGLTPVTKPATPRAGRDADRANSRTPQPDEVRAAASLSALLRHRRAGRVGQTRSTPR